MNRDKHAYRQLLRQYDDRVYEIDEVVVNIKTLTDAYVLAVKLAIANKEYWKGVEKLGLKIPRGELFAGCIDDCVGDLIFGLTEERDPMQEALDAADFERD